MIKIAGGIFIKSAANFRPGTTPVVRKVPVRPPVRSNISGRTLGSAGGTRRPAQGFGGGLSAEQQKQVDLAKNRQGGAMTALNTGRDMLASGLDRVGLGVLNTKIGQQHVHA